LDRLPITKEVTEMVNRNHKNLVCEIDKLNENEALAVNRYVSELLFARHSKTIETIPNDDLIASLSDKRENQRARQVLEWEKVRRKNLQKMA